MLTQLSVSNFKSWRHIDGIRLGSITGLFGTNSSGKSSILQLLLLIKQTIESSDRAAVLEFGDDRSLTYLGNFHDVLFNHKEEVSLDFALGWDLERSRRFKDPVSGRRITYRDITFGASVAQNEASRLHVVQFCYEVASNAIAMQQKQDEPGRYELSCEGG
jgi:predicted ATPase